MYKYSKNHINIDMVLRVLHGVRLYSQLCEWVLFKYQNVEIKK